MSNDLLFTIGANDKASSIISKVNKNIKYLDKEYNTAKKSSKDFENSQEGIAKRLQTLNAKYDQHKIKLQAYNKQLEEAKKKVNEQTQKLEQLKSAEGDNTEEIAKAEQQLAKYKDQMTKAAQNISLTETEMKNLQGQIEATNEEFASRYPNQYSEQLRKMGEKAQEAGKKISAVGDGIENAGKKMSVLSAGIGALGAAAIKSYKDVKTGMDNVIQATGATGEAAKELEEVYHNIGRSSSEDWDTIGSALGEVNTRFGFAGKAAEDCTEDFLKFARINKMDATQAVQLVSRAMGDAGIKAENYGEILDDLSVAAQASGVSMNKLTEYITKYGAPMRALGMDTKESIAIFAGWEKAGVNTEISFSGMKQAIGKWSKQGKDARVEFKKTLEEIKKCPNIADATTKAIEVFGQKAGPDLADAIQNGRFEYEDMLKLIKGSKGTVENTFGAVEDATDQAKKAWHEAQVALADLGKTILTSATPLLKDLTKAVKTASDWWTKLDDKTKNLIVKLGGLAAAAGPATIGVGKLTQCVGGAVTAGGKFLTWLSKAGSGAAVFGTAAETASTGGVASLTAGSIALGPAILGVGAAVAAAAVAVGVYKEHSDLMNSTILKSKEELSPLQQLMSDLGGNTHYTAAELENMGYKFKDWNSNIAPETQKALEECAAKARDLNTEITLIDLDNAITGDEVEAAKKKTNDFCNSVIETIKSRQDESHKAISDLFNMDSVVTDNEQYVLDALNKESDKHIQLVEEYNKELNAIYQKACDEKRGLTEQELQNAHDLVNKIAEEGMKATVNSEQQMLEVQADFNTRCSNQSLETANQMMTERKQIYDQDIQNIHDQYDKSLNELQLLADRQTGIDRQKTLDELKIKTQERDGLLQMEKDKYDEYWRLLETNYPKLASEINKYTGQILSDKDKKCREEFEITKSHYANLDKITTDGLHKVYNTETNTWDNIIVKTDEASGEIIGMAKLVQDKYGVYYEQLEGYSKEYMEQMRKEAEQTGVQKNRQIQMIKQMAYSTVDADNQIVGANGKVIGSLQQVTNNVDGTRTGILDLNGTPVQVKVNKDGTIANLKDIEREYGRIQSKTIYINVYSQMSDQTRQVVRAMNSHAVWSYGYAEGTTNAAAGLATVAEEGPELIINKAGTKAMLATAPQFLTMAGGETVVPADLTAKALSRNISGGYFNSNSYESRRFFKGNRFGSLETEPIDIGKTVNELMAAFINALSNTKLSADVDLNYVGRAITPQITKNITKTQWERRAYK